MRKFLLPAATFIAAFAVVAAKPVKPSYLFVWAGDSAGKASDFLTVIDASPSSKHYGEVVATIKTGVSGSHPHHTEGEMPANGHLLANGFGAGRTWLFDLTKPTEPKIITSFGDLGGYSHPHTYVRTANGNLLTTFQYRAMPGDSVMHHMEGMSMSDPTEHSTGGIVEMDERGKVLRVGNATSTAQKYIYPYSVLPIPSMNRAVSTTTDMNEADTMATSEWIQFWRLSDLKLLSTVALKPGPRGNENRYTGEPRLLGDGKSVYIHTFNCGLYLVRGIDRPQPTSTFVMAFEGSNCGVPILAGKYWIQPTPESHSVLSMDVSDPMHPKEVSRVKFDDREYPHWLAMDPTGRRLVMNSGGSPSNRIYIINFNPATGALAIDDKFRDAGSDVPGVSMRNKIWAHEMIAKAIPHGSVFSR